ncbi:hypothetical protein CIK05_02850 [Bdellovibrio sp. qaytius]|nr:hypothetical protein CIK05_02850 [Bdellovibrio sp. qaytius]
MRLDGMSQIFLSILGLALFTWVAKYFFVLYYYRKKKEDINRLEARVAVLRMLLKAKLKRKGSQMQDQYKDEKEFMALVISKLDLLTTFNFNRTSDYEDVLDILTAVSEAIDLHTVQKNPALYMAQQEKIAQDRENLLIQSGEQVSKVDEKGDSKSADEIDSKKRSIVNVQIPKYDRWTQLLKYDKGNLYIVKEIVETTDDLKTKIDLYNSEQDNKELLLRAPEPIEIDSFEGLKAIVDRDLEQSKAGKAAKKQKKQKLDADLMALDAPAGDPASSSDSGNGQSGAA